MGNLCVSQSFSVSVIVQEEAEFKVSPAADAQVLYYNSESIMLNQPIYASEAIRQDRNSLSPSRGNFDIGGTIECELSPYSASMVKFALGTVNTSAGPPYTHTIKVGNPPSFLLEKGFTDVKSYNPLESPFFLYNGCKVNSLNITFANNGILKGTFAIMGAKETPGLTTFDATPTDNGHDPWDMTECTFEEGGVSSSIVREANMSIENNLAGDYYVIGGAGERECLPAGYCRISGTITALFRDMVQYNKAYNFTESSLDFAFSRGTGLGTAGNESMVVTIPEIKYAAQSPSVQGPGGVDITFPFDAYYADAAEATSCQIVFKNIMAAI